MLCISPVNGHRCGRCMACRISRQREKKIRICHESEYFIKKCFLTLTYDENHIPENGSLVKKDLQDFMKRLRKYFPAQSIKYFACGEYGDQTHRPHYHVILFGCDMYDTPFKVLRKFKTECWCECRAWDKGQCTIAPFNEARASYVAKYCVKKWTGKDAEEHYQGRQPEFCLASQGLGLHWLKDHAKLVVQDGFIRVGQGGRAPLPRYYEQKLYPERDRYCKEACNYRYNKMVNADKVLKDTWTQARSETVEDFNKYVKECRDQLARQMSIRIQNKGKSNNV